MKSLGFKDGVEWVEVEVGHDAKMTVDELTAAARRLGCELRHWDGMVADISAADHEAARRHFWWVQGPRVESK